jgi:hypothetical protein
MRRLSASENSMARYLLSEAQILPADNFGAGIILQKRYSIVTSPATYAQTKTAPKFNPTCQV